jgi:hypothetical protein
MMAFIDRENNPELGKEDCPSIGAPFGIGVYESNLSFDEPDDDKAASIVELVAKCHLIAAEKRIAELVGCIKNIAEGDVGRPHRIDKCDHGNYGFERCEECYQAYVDKSSAELEKQ